MSKLMTTKIYRNYGAQQSILPLIFKKTKIGQEQVYLPHFLYEF